MTIVMKTMPAGKFKAQCLAVLDEVAELHQEVVITKRGKAVAKLVPVEVEDELKDSGFGRLKGRVIIHGDIIGPFFEDWAQWDENNPGE